MELADSLELCANPLHPYSRGPFTAALPAHPDQRHEKLTITGEIPSALDPPRGCRFHPRCPHAMPHCAGGPPRKEVARRHTVGCHLHRSEEPKACLFAAVCRSSAGSVRWPSMRRPLPPDRNHRLCCRPDRRRALCPECNRCHRDKRASQLPCKLLKKQMRAAARHDN